MAVVMVVVVSGYALCANPTYAANEIAGRISAA
jgi:hypothetical protein